MISYGIIKFVITLSIPWIIRKLFSLVRTILSRDTKVKHSKPKLSFKHRFAYAVSFLAVFSYLYAIYDEKTRGNFYKLLDASKKSPGFMLTTKFDTFVTKRANSSRGFAEARDKLTETSFLHTKGDAYDVYRQEKYKRMFKSLVLLDVIKGYLGLKRSLNPDITDEEIEYATCKYIYDNIKTNAKRKIYLKYGERAFTDCKFCKEENDYLMFVTPIIALSYITFLIVVGYLTTVPAKSSWRMPSLIFMCAVAATEILYFVAPAEINLVGVYNSIFSGDITSGPYQKVGILRNALLGGFLLMVTVFDNEKRKISNTVNEVISLQNKMFTRMDVLQFQRLSILLDKNIYKFYNDNSPSADREANVESIKQYMSELPADGHNNS